MGTIRIEDLKLRAIIGINDWERKKKQDIIINITIQFDSKKASRSDSIKDTIDYKKITKAVIKKVEPSKFFLLEKLAKLITDIVMAEPLADEVTVKINKPHALRFAESVSFELTEKR